MSTYVTPKKNAAFKFYVGLIDQSNTKLLKANPTIASGDFKVSTDGGAFANLATLPSANPASGRSVMIDLSAGEMNGDNIAVQCVDAAGAEWCDLLLNIQTSARQIDDLAYPATSGRSMVVDANGLVDANTVKVGPTGSGTAQTARDVGASVLLSAGTGAGQLDFTSGVVKANVTQSTPTLATATAVAAIQADTDDIQTRLPAALTGGGLIKADALAFDSSTEAASRVRRSALSIVLATCAGGGSTTSVITSSLSPASAVNSQFNGRIILFDKDTTTAALRGQGTRITAFVTSTQTFTVDALTDAPVSGDTFTIN